MRGKREIFAEGAYDFAIFVLSLVLFFPFSQFFSLSNKTFIVKGFIPAKRTIILILNHIYLMFISLSLFFISTYLSTKKWL